MCTRADAKELELDQLYDGFRAQALQDPTSATAAVARFAPDHFSSTLRFHHEVANIRAMGYVMEGLSASPLLDEGEGERPLLRMPDDRMSQLADAVCSSSQLRSCYFPDYPIIEECNHSESILGLSSRYTSTLNPALQLMMPIIPTLLMLVLEVLLATLLVLWTGPAAAIARASTAVGVAARAAWTSIAELLWPFSRVGPAWLSPAMMFRTLMYLLAGGTAIKTALDHRDELQTARQLLGAMALREAAQTRLVQRFAERWAENAVVRRDSGYLQSVFWKPLDEVTQIEDAFTALRREAGGDLQAYLAQMSTSRVLFWLWKLVGDRRGPRALKLNELASRVAGWAVWAHGGAGRLVRAELGGAGEETELLGATNPFLDAAVCVPQDARLQKSQIITGGNATGKTTYTKTVMINMMLVHSLGVGFFRACKLARPYTHLLCYLEVPDTSTSRDSLFQAEARRVAGLLQTADTEDAHVLVILDEVFTGTNPRDAAAAVLALARFVDARLAPRFTYLLTTHFTDVATVVEGETKFTHTVCLQTAADESRRLLPGVSTASTVRDVLAAPDMGFPSEFLNLLNAGADAPSIADID